MDGRARNRPIALCYHAVSERWPAALSVTPQRLEAQIELLLGRGYRGVTLSEMVESRSSEKLVAITFDDAFRSVIDLAEPILRRLGVSATLFVPTTFAGKESLVWAGVDQWLDGPFDDEMVPMSWEQIIALSDAGWEIGSHTRTHPWLTTLDDATLEAELSRSRTDCEARLGKPCRALAYPYGDHDQRVVAAAGRAGYSVAATLTDRLRWPASPLRWPRIGIYHADTSFRFRLKVSPRVRRLRQRIPDPGSPLRPEHRSVQ